MKSYDEAIRDFKAEEILEDEKQKLEETLNEIIDELEELKDGNEE